MDGTKVKTLQRSGKVGEFLIKSEMITVYILVALVAVTSIINPTFLQVENLISILKQYSFYGICGVMLTFLMVSLAFDMSLGNTVALSGCVAAILMRDYGASFWVGALVALALGTCLGLINGFLHGVLRIQAFMATLGTCYIYKGIFWVISKQASVDCSVAVNATGIPNMVLGVPISIWVLAIMAIAGHLVLKYTKFGRSTYVIGNNLEVAREIGINDAKVKVILFGCLGFVSGLCAICFMLTYGAIPPSTGAKYEFYVNAGTVIGGCSVYGGRGSIVGSLIGTAVMTIVQFSLRSLDIPPGYQNTVLGAILLFAIVVDTIKEKKKM